MMHTYKIWMVGCLLFVAAAVVWGQAPGVQFAPEEGVIVLKNGQVLKGRVTKAGDRYHLWQPNGEIRLTVEQVDFVCRSIEEAYFFRAAAAERGGVGEHVKLAEWCIDQKLWDFAQRELAIIQQQVPQEPKTAFLQRRLKIGRNQEEAANQSAINQTNPKEAGISGEELDKMVRQLPPGVMETFTLKIQPLLMNSCTAGGCHGTQSDLSLSFLKATPQRPGFRRSTQRNLHFVLQLLNRENTQASPLLAIPLGPHGGLKGPVFSNREADQYQLLVDWAFQTFNKSAPQYEKNKLPPQPTAANRVVPAVAEKSSNDPLAHWNPIIQTSENTPVSESGEARPRVKFGAVAPSLMPEVPTAGRLPQVADPFGVPRAEPPPQFPTINDTPHRSPPQRGSIPVEHTPNDPFDPDIFNRRYFPSGTTPSR